LRVGVEGFVAVPLLRPPLSRFLQVHRSLGRRQPLSLVVMRTEGGEKWRLYLQLETQAMYSWSRTELQFRKFWKPGLEDQWS